MRAMLPRYLVGSVWEGYRMNDKGFQHDYGADEWHYKCSACGVMLYAPTLDEMQRALPRHTKSKDCLGGW